MPLSYTKACTQHISLLEQEASLAATLGGEAVDGGRSSIGVSEWLLVALCFESASVRTCPWVFTLYRLPSLTLYPESVLSVAPVAVHPLSEAWIECCDEGQCCLLLIRSTRRILPV